MTILKKALIGPRRFQWNAWMWFGSAIGSSDWMVVTGCLLLFYFQVIPASLMFACFLCVNAIALKLWRNRDRVFPFTGLMLLLSALSIIVPVSWAAIGLLASPVALSELYWSSSPYVTIAVACYTPMLMTLLLYFELNWTERFDADPAPSKKIVP